MSAVAVCAIALVLKIASALATTQPAADAMAAADADESWTCPMHPDVLESAAGTCPMCRMNLVPIHLETAWSCPVHSFLDESEPGSCPLCKRDLVQVTVGVTGTTRALRPHGNHSPQHGGQFFMAADNWHHLEGVYERPGVFRLHLYDDFSRPLGERDFQAVSGTLATGDGTFPLEAGRDGAYLEAKVSPSSLPEDVTARVRFTVQGPEYRFDFTLNAPWNAPAVAAAPAPAPSSPSRESATVDQMLAELHQLSAVIRERIDNGSFTEVYQPAFQARDVALTLDDQRVKVPSQRRDAAADALATLVRTAWLLDTSGDLGNRELLVDGYDQFKAALMRVDAAFDAR